MCRVGRNFFFQPPPLLSKKNKRSFSNHKEEKMKRRNVRTEGQTSSDQMFRSSNGNKNFVVKAIASLDAYPKVKEDYARGSTLGAAITLICFLACLCLFFSEYRTHLVSKIESELDVDTMGVNKFESNAERLRVRGCNISQLGV